VKVAVPALKHDVCNTEVYF